MWTHERLKPKKWAEQPAKYKQMKYNGHRCTFFKQGDGQLVGFERTIRADREIRLLRPKIKEYRWWKILDKIPPMSSVDGELYVDFGNAGDAAHAIAECSKDLDFMPFAVPYWEGFQMYSQGVFFCEKELKPLGLKTAEVFGVYEHDTYESMCYDAEQLDIEGWVLKNYNYDEWWKVKPQREVDAIVTGFVDGNGKYLGLVGSLKCSVYINGELEEIAKVSGMDDEVRINIDEEKDLGRVCEIEYQEVGNGGRLIHAHFQRWRDDKPVEECVVVRSDL